jgi:hypothetical protein
MPHLLDVAGFGQDAPPQAAGLPPALHVAIPPREACKSFRLGTGQVLTGFVMTAAGFEQEYGSGPRVDAELAESGWTAVRFGPVVLLVRSDRLPAAPVTLNITEPGTYSVAFGSQTFIRRRGPARGMVDLAEVQRHARRDAQSALRRGRPASEAMEAVDVELVDPEGISDPCTFRRGSLQKFHRDDVAEARRVARKAIRRVYRRRRLH